MAYNDYEYYETTADKFRGEGSEIEALLARPELSVPPGPALTKLGVTSARKALAASEEVIRSLYCRVRDLTYALTAQRAEVLRLTEITDAYALCDSLCDDIHLALCVTGMPRGKRSKVTARATKRKNNYYSGPRA